MTFERELGSFFQSISDARTVGALEATGRGIAEQLGFRWFAHLVLTEEHASVTSSYPKPWTHHYLASRYQNLDPVVHRAQTSLDPFSWSGDIPKANHDPAQRRFFDEASHYGIKRGITVPIRGGFGTAAAFTFASDDRPVWAETMLHDQTIAARTIAIHFHARRTLIGNMTDPRIRIDHGLTERELECLGGMASGKTAAETAVALGITRRTVEFHLENARRKLGAASTAHCIAIAVKQGFLR